MDVGDGLYPPPAPPGRRVVVYTYIIPTPNPPAKGSFGGMIGLFCLGFDFFYKFGKKSN